MTLLIVQMTVVLSISLACGWVARRFGQARVIGEIVGGILIFTMLVVMALVTTMVTVPALNLLRIGDRAPQPQDLAQPKAA